jgi:hypothetical protein
LYFYKHGVERVVREDPYAGLIVLMHGIGLFNKVFGLVACMADHTARPDVQAYIRDQDALRQRVSIFRQQLNDCEGYRIPEQTTEARLPQIPLRALH